MLSASTNFTTKNDLAQKEPISVIEFDGASQKFCDHLTSDADSNYKQLIVEISGLDQTITPEKGKASIGGLSFTLLDDAELVSGLIAADATFFHRKKVTLKSGYVGNAYADLLQEFTGWVTGMKRGKGPTWIFNATDPQKWLQKTIFRSATDASPYIIEGNAVNILLSILTSSDAGTNSDYDLGDADYGCDLDSNSVNITAIELVRNQRFWGQTHNLYFEITEKQKAKDFIEKELLQVLNCYPQIDGSGKYFIIPFAPPVATQNVQTFNDSNIIGIPSLDMNLEAMVNEVEFQIDYDPDTGSYDNIYYYVDATSYSARGPSSDTLQIKSKGIKTSAGTRSIPSHGLEIISRRKTAVFSRLSTPPIEIKFDAFFSRRLTEAGDIVPFSHTRVMDVEAGTIGITSKSMEVVTKRINRKSGKTQFVLLDTGFDKGTYSTFSPYMTITAASSGTAFTVSVADANTWEEGWEARIVDQYMNIKASSITILTINTGTGAITCDDIGVTPTVGWMVIFGGYDNAASDQIKYAYMADNSNYLGTANDAAHLLSS